MTTSGLGAGAAACARFTFPLARASRPASSFPTTSSATSASSSTGRSTGHGPASGAPTIRSRPFTRSDASGREERTLRWAAPVPAGSSRGPTSSSVGGGPGGGATGALGAGESSVAGGRGLSRDRTTTSTSAAMPSRPIPITIAFAAELGDSGRPKRSLRREGRSGRFKELSPGQV